MLRVAASRVGPVVLRLREGSNIFRWGPILSGGGRLITGGGSEKDTTAAPPSATYILLRQKQISVENR